MKKISNFLYFFLFISLIISSCKKDEDDSNNNSSSVVGCTDTSACNYNILANNDDGTCEYGLAGCTDPLAFNYNIMNVCDDNSCIYAYDIAQGVWNLDPNCEEINIPLIGSISLNEQMPETVNVLGGVGNTLYINLSLNSGSSEVSGQIDNEGNITVPSQNITVDVGMGPMNITVSGSGKINSTTLGEIDLLFEGEIEVLQIPIPIPFDTECSMTLSK